MTLEEFVKRFGGIYEHSPWVAEQAYTHAEACADTDKLAAIFAECVDTASKAQKLELIRAHPDLAGKAAVAGELSNDSNVEQSSAGIDQCTPEEFAEFQAMNERYKARFSFPFVMAVRNSNRQQILAAFTERLNNDVDMEFDRAIMEIHKIARLRLEVIDRV